MFKYLKIFNSWIKKNLNKIYYGHVENINQHCYPNTKYTMFESHIDHIKPALMEADKIIVTSIKWPEKGDKNE